MTRRIRLDLHTHPVEALRETLGIKGIRDINSNVAGSIVQAVKSAGLDGLAITERENFNHGWVACLEILEHFKTEKLICLAGAEIEFQGEYYLQIYIPPYLRGRIPFFQNKEWFVILTHPGYFNTWDSQSSPALFDAVEEQSVRGKFDLARDIAARNGVPSIRSSAAHKLEDIGAFWTELEMK